MNLRRFYVVKEPPRTAVAAVHETEIASHVAPSNSCNCGSSVPWPVALARRCWWCYEIRFLRNRSHAMFTVSARPHVIALTLRLFVSRKLAPHRARKRPTWGVSSELNIIQPASLSMACDPGLLQLQQPRRGRLEMSCPTTNTDLLPPLPENRPVAYGEFPTIGICNACSIVCVLMYQIQHIYVRTAAFLLICSSLFTTSGRDNTQKRQKQYTRVYPQR